MSKARRSAVNTFEGVEIGSGFTGGIDDLHLYARALSNAEIATLAGRSGSPNVPVECL